MIIKKCSACGGYTISEYHCGEKSKTAHPPKFSSEDRLGKYRRMAKKGILSNNK